MEDGAGNGPQRARAKFRFDPAAHPDGISGVGTSRERGYKNG
jgi:hypothetical protein